MTSTLDCVRRALVIAPHPDDEVLGCGGTMKRLADAGAEVHVAIVTRAGEAEFGPDAATVGRMEARFAHEALGVRETHFIDFPAAALDTVPHAQMNAALCRLVNAIGPDALFVPFLGDVHLDHQLTFLSSMVAARPRGANAPARVFSYETLSETNWYAPGLTPVFAPNVYFDISRTLEAKLSAFALYRSQVKEPPDERSIEVIRALAQLRGATVHRPAAEAFMLLREIG
jgi:LmbE family N-acetylglucosaminyl deacetylase